MLFKIFVFVHFLFVKEIIAQYHIQDFLNQNVYGQQQILRRCPRQASNLQSNIAINSNLPINGPNSGVPIGNPAWQNMRSSMPANELLQNVNNLPINLQNPLLNNLPGNGLSSNINGMSYMGMPAANNFGGNGFINANSVPYGNSFAVGNQVAMNNIQPNYYNRPVNNNPNLINFPRGGAFLSGNNLAGADILPNMNNNFPGQNFLPNGNLNFPQNNLPFDNPLLNTVNFPNNNGGSNFNNYAVNSNMPCGNINNPFTVNSNMPLHTIVPNTNNIQGNGLSNGVPYLNSAWNNNQLLSDGFPVGNGMSVRGYPTNSLPMNSLQYDLSNLAAKQNIIQNVIPSLSSFQTDSQLGVANSLNLANNLQLDGFGNLPLTNGLALNGITDSVSNLNSLCI